MPRLSLEIRASNNLLDRIINNVYKKTDTETQAAAEDIVKDIRASWSRRAPSAAGQPPAMVSGTLDASVVAAPQQSISSGKTQTAIVVYAEYASFLEYGTSKMAARPFVRPAMKRAEKTFFRRMKLILSK